MEGGGSLGLQKVTFALCVLCKNSKEEVGRECKKERNKERKMWAGSAKLLQRSGVMEKALCGVFSMQEYQVASSHYNDVCPSQFLLLSVTSLECSFLYSTHTSPLFLSDWQCSVR